MIRCGLARTLIIGYGNPLRGDDGFGWHAACRLREAIHDPDIEILAVQQLTPELMEPVSRAERVIFLDAAVGEEPGRVTKAAVDPGEGTAAAFTHFSTPAALLAGARALYGARPAALLITVDGRDFEIGAELSEAVRHALDTLVETKLRDAISQAASGPEEPR
jgi:hydrogenase maturation protease